MQCVVWSNENTFVSESGGVAFDLGPVKLNTRFSKLQHLLLSGCIDAENGPENSLHALA